MGRDISTADFPGSYIPFPNPVGLVPTVSIGEEPTVSLCVNETWWPYVIGALKALYRPETWDDTMDNITVAQQQFNELISNIQSGCVRVPTVGCFRCDFTQQDYDFQFNPSGNCDATWASGVGWQSCSPGITSPDELRVLRPLKPVATYISGATIVYNVDAPAVSSQITLTLRLNGVQTYTTTQNDTGPGQHTLTVSPAAQADEIEIDIYRTGGQFGTMQLTSLELCYAGSFPLSTGFFAPPVFAHTFDFRFTDGGWTTFNAGATWVSGTGWRAVHAYNGYVIYIQHSLPATQIYRVEVNYAFDSGSCLDNNCNIAYGGNSCQDNQDGTTTGQWSCNNSLSSTNIAISAGSDLQGRNCSDPWTIASITVYGYGADPF